MLEGSCRFPVIIRGLRCCLLLRGLGVYMRCVKLRDTVDKDLFGRRAQL